MDPIGQLQQIKEIIFGPEMEDLVKRIESLEAKLAAHEQKASEDSQLMKDGIEKHILKTQTDLESKIDKAIKKFEQKRKT